MAESNNNVITHGLSGKLGDLIVFRNRNGKTIVANKPAPRTGELSEAQKEHQKFFQEATIYGKAALTDPATKAGYAAAASNGETAYNVAVADFFHAPNIDEINESNSRGKIGGTIKVKATDDFKVAEVSVAIYNADGSGVQHGLAVQSANGVEWVYTATANNASLDGDKIIVRVSDLPGHLTPGEKSF